MGDSGGASAQCGSALNVTQVLLDTGVCPSAGPSAWDVAQEAAMYSTTPTTTPTASSVSSPPTQTSASPVNAHIYSGSLALGPTSSSGGITALAWAVPTAASSFDWTYEPVTAASANGFIVNADSGLCLAYDAVDGNYRVFETQCGDTGASGYIETTWQLSAVSGGVQLSQSDISGCLSTPTGAGPATMGTCSNATVVGFGVSVTSGPVTSSGAPIIAAAAHTIIGQGSWLCLSAGSPTPGTSVTTLTTHNCSSASAAPGEQWTYVPQSQQLWVYGQPNTALGAQEPQALCVSVPITSSASSSGGLTSPVTYSSVPLAATCVPGASNEQWQVNGNGTVKNPASGQCLNVDGSSTSAGAAVIMWACNNDNNEQWAVQTGFVAGSGIYAGFGSGRGLVDHAGTLALSDGPSDAWVWQSIATNSGKNRGLLYDRTTGQCYGKVPNGWGFAGCDQNSGQSAVHPQHDLERELPQRLQWIGTVHHR